MTDEDPIEGTSPGGEPEPKETTDDDPSGPPAGSRTAATETLTDLATHSAEHWYENGFIYAIDVKSFYDSNGDGIGDFQGLTERLDYLDRLGVSCIWLLPIYPSLQEDNGYSVKDYYALDERLGTFGDFVRFVRQAHRRGIKVLLDLVVNHTAIEHPWFQKAREDPDSKYRDYYVFTEDPPEDTKEPIFPEEGSVWTYDEVAGAYYYHRFHDFQPGLDHSNPAVREEVCKIIDFWLELGIDGFRVDATPLMIQKKGLPSTEPDEPHRILKDYRAFVSRRSTDAILLGEAGGDPDAVKPYFGDGSGDEMQMLFNFVLTDYLFAGLATESTDPVIKGLESIPLPPRNGQWANFLRNLDELNLEWLPEDLQDAVLDRFSPEEHMQIYGRGNRRRLAPMLEDRQLIELAYSLLFSVPGTPVIPYGDEIGMGEDLSLEGREAVRTPMQWTSEENGGFSAAPSSELIRPVIDEGPYSYERVNADDQRDDPDSLLQWMTRAITILREHPTFGRGQAEILEVDADGVLAHRIDGEGVVLAVHNLTNEERTAHLSVDDDLASIFDDGRCNYDENPDEIDLAPYGYVWFRGGGMRL